jgi:hypothetical protein
MTALLGQVSAAKVKKFSLKLCDRALDSDDPATLCLEVVGTIKIFDEESVHFY